MDGAESDRNLGCKGLKTNRLSILLCMGKSN